MVGLSNKEVPSPYPLPLRWERRYEDPIEMERKYEALSSKSERRYRLLCLRWEWEIATLLAIVACRFAG
jgi:hypothetical protein